MNSDSKPKHYRFKRIKPILKKIRIYKTCRRCKIDLDQDNTKQQDGFCSLDCKKKGTEYGAQAGRRFAVAKLRKQVLERDGYRCVYCKCDLTDKTAQMDHKIPWPKGLTVMRNLVSSCHDCNREKGRGTVSKLKRNQKKTHLGRKRTDWVFVAPHLNGPVNIIQEKK